MLNSNEGVRVTRMDESDYGTEIRVEVELDGRTVELQVTNGSGQWEVDLWEYGPDRLHPYRGGRQLYREMLERVG